MIINNITLCGFDKLFEGYKEAFDNGRTGFTTKLYTFLNHVMATFDLKGVTGIELYYLKTFASSITIIDDDLYTIGDDGAIGALSEELIQLTSEISHDPDMKPLYNDNIQNINMIGSLACRVIATFTGPAILSITGAYTDSLFKTNNVYDDIYAGNDVIGKRIAPMFSKSFYEYAYNRLSEFDLTAEFILNRKYYQYNDDMCSLADVIGPYGEITFFGNDETGLMQQIKNFAETKKSISAMPIITDSFFDEVRLTFSITSTFQTFLYLYTRTNYVNEHENLKVVFKNPDVLLSTNVKMKYQTRLNDIIQQINTIKEKKDFVKSLKDLNLIFLGTPIKYNIQIPLRHTFSCSFIPVYNNDTPAEVLSICTKIMSLANGVVDTIESLAQ